jgi:hypothetical protein
VKSTRAKVLPQVSASWHQHVQYIHLEQILTGVKCNLGHFDAVHLPARNLLHVSLGITFSSNVGDVLLETTEVVPSCLLSTSANLSTSGIGSIPSHCPSHEQIIIVKVNERLTLTARRARTCSCTHLRPYGQNPVRQYLRHISCPSASASSNVF